MKVTLRPPWLAVDLGAPRPVLSFAPHRPGLVTARHVIWRQVRDADLTPDLDAAGWLGAELAGIGRARAVGMLTSRRLDSWRQARAGPVGCVATVGLGNAERVGHRQPVRPGWGTINLAVSIDEGLTTPALIEALSIVAQARTAAVIAAGLALPQGPATGTGTDCIAVAAPTGPGRWAGLHTALGEALGAAVFAAVADGCAQWLAEQARPDHPPAPALRAPGP